MRDFLYVLIMSMVPVVELRGAIPLGAGLGLGVAENLIACIVGNMIPVPFILLFVRPVVKWMNRRREFSKIALFLENKVHKNKDKVIKYELLGLMLLVAVPLPGTGAWTGALIAAFLDIRMKKSVPAIFAGVVAAGIIVSVVTYGVKGIIV